MEERIDGIYYKDVVVNFNECDNKGTAKISSLMKYLAELAGNDYCERGMSHKFLWKHDFVFLVSRVSAVIHKNIQAEQKIRLGTFEKGVKGPIFYRDFFIEDECGERVIEAKSAWILCNPTTREILRPSNFLCEIVPRWEQTVECEEPKKLFVPQDLNFVGTRKIVYSDLDSNGHVYNAVYADIACDFLPFEMLENQIKSFKINFAKEALIGESMQIYTSISEGKSIVVGKNGDIVNFECQLMF